MDSKKIKIAMVTNHFGITGISRVILNYCEALDKKKYNLTVIAGKPIATENKDECQKNGINLIELPSRHNDAVRHYSGLLKVLKYNKYDIVHVHGSSSMMAIELTLAMLAGTKIRIAHSHNSMCQNMLIHKLLNSYFRRICTKSIACGKMAGDWLYGENNFEILPNGFKTKEFEFNKLERNKIREKLNIKDKFVIGHVGRFNDQKNHEYLIKVFEHVAEKRQDAILLLVGDGPNFNKIKSSIEESECRKQIILYGATKNTQSMYSAMDVFVLPSKYEGLPVVLLEAQISGLPCVVSDRVTKEVDFGEVKWLSIYDDSRKWAELIVNTRAKTEEDRSEYREQNISKIDEYDIDFTRKQLEEIYDQLLSR